MTPWQARKAGAALRLRWDELISRERPRRIDDARRWVLGRRGHALVDAGHRFVAERIEELWLELSQAARRSPRIVPEVDGVVAIGSMRSRGADVHEVLARLLS